MVGGYRARWRAPLGPGRAPLLQVLVLQIMKFAALRKTAAACVLLVCSGCGSGGPIPPPASPLSTPSELCTSEVPQSPCLPPRDVENWLRSATLRVLGVAETSGSSGAKLLTLRVDLPGRAVTLRAKWREYDSSLFNDARKEIAAYATQKLVFRPHEYVVPPAVGRCFPLARYRGFMGTRAAASFEGTRCVFGSLSYWLENVRSTRAFDKRRFRRDADYRRAMADVNLFTFLIQHGDTHEGNFLIAGDDSGSRTRVYSPDNAIAFSPLMRNPLDLFRANWYELRVPALRKQVVKRLRAIDRSELESLAVIEQYRIIDRQLRPTEPGPAIGGDSGIRRTAGILQLGLTPTEIERLHDRIELALDRVKSGDIGVF